jgi:hypothetical protein
MAGADGDIPWIAFAVNRMKRSNDRLLRTRTDAERSDGDIPWIAFAVNRMKR